MKKGDKAKILSGLNKTTIFKNLPDKVLLRLSKKAELEVYNPKDIIVKEGDPSNRLFIIINGIVTVKKVMTDRQDKIFAYLLPGSTFGEVGILENKTRSATVEAMTDVEVLVFDREYFIDILHRHPGVAIELAKLLGYYLTESNKRLARGGKEKKVALVFDWFNTHGAPELGKQLAIRLLKGTDKKTIYAEYPFNNTLSNELDVQKQEIFHHKSGLDILLLGSLTVQSRYANMTLMLDDLLNRYENLIIYVNKDFDEDLSQIIENVDQIIVVGSGDKEQWKYISEFHREIRDHIKENNTRIFTILINNEPTDNFRLDPPPDFKVVYSDETTNYQLWSEDGTHKVSESFDEAVNIFVDRLQRSNHLGIFIPTTFEVDKQIDTSEYIDRTLKFLGKRFGGATSEEVKGVWNSEEIGLVGEKLYKVHTYATTKDLKTHLDEVVEYVRVIKHELRQEAMALEINRKLTLL